MLANCTVTGRNLQIIIVPRSFPTLRSEITLYHLIATWRISRDGTTNILISFCHNYFNYLAISATCLSGSRRRGAQKPCLSPSGVQIGEEERET